MRLERWIRMIASLSVLACASSASLSAGEREMRLTQEQVQHLREVYRQVQQAETKLSRLIEQAERQELLLRPTKEALKRMKAFLAAQDHQRLEEYLDRTASYRLYEDCKAVFSQSKSWEILNDPNQERLIRGPMVHYFRHKAPPEVRASAGLELDPNDPNYTDDMLWQDIKHVHSRRIPEAYFQQQREYFIKERGAPAWLPDYAANVAFADGMIGWYEAGLLLLTGREIRDTEAELTRLYAEMSAIHPRWNRIRSLLADPDSPDNQQVIDAVQEHLRLSPTARLK